jgi:4-amino-4-deoxy-L-arabinose transferase-like glycosyltransferase
MEATHSFAPWRGWLERHSHLLAAAILVLALVGYLYHLDSWHMYDDEGGYLYAAWRISDGEVPYRDFLTPQAPVFLYIGAAVVRLVGPSAIGLRLATVGTTLLTAWLFYLVAKDAFGSPVALASLAVFLVHRNVYFMARFFRAEAYMLFFDLLGLYLGAQFHRRGKSWLAWGAGMAFALATLCKLFGLLPFVGYMLFLFLNRVHSRRRWQFWTAIRSLVGPAIGFAVASVGILLPFHLANLNLSEFLLGHHVRQGVGLSWLQVLVNGLNYYRDYVLLWPVYVALAMVGAAVAWRRRADFPLGTLFLTQLPTGAAFLLISRFLRPRLLIFLAPAGSVLMALGTAWVTHRLSLRLPSSVRRPAWAVTGLLLAAWALYPHVRQDYEISQWQDGDTIQVARGLSGRIAPDEVMLCDYPGLNFYAQRKSTYLGTGLSGGAVWGSQIRGFMLARELESQPYQGRRWVVIDVSPATGHTMVGLHDYGWFLEFLDGAGFEVVDEVVREQQLLRVYRASPQPLPAEIETPLQVDLGEHIQLLGFYLPHTAVQAGEPLTLTLYWRVEQPIDADYKVFVHLVDDDGVLRAQEDVRPRYGRFPTYLWVPGPVIVDEHQLSLPPDLAPGTYTLGVGLYLWPSGARLPAIGTDGHRLPNDWIALPVSVTVR